jgi:L-amino acid N-acyltransferase YncA
MPENQISLARGRHRLRDGRTVIIRSARPGDEPDVLRFLSWRSVSARRLRFFTAAGDPGTVARRGALLDPSDRASLVALDEHGQIAGHAVYLRTYGPRAEVAVEVDDDPHELVLARLLITELARVATQSQIHRFVAEVLPENDAMLSVFRDAFDASTELDEGVVYVDFPTGGWCRDDGLARRRERGSTIAPALVPAPPVAEEGRGDTVRLPSRAVLASPCFAPEHRRAISSGPNSRPASVSTTKWSAPRRQEPSGQPPAPPTRRSTQAKETQ